MLSDMVLSTLILLGATTAFAPKITLDDGLNTGENGIDSCSIDYRKDGPHLIISIASPHIGDQIQFTPDEQMVNYDFIFNKKAIKEKIYKLQNRKLENPGFFDITMKAAMGLRNFGSRNARVTKIFAKPGDYTLYIGYGFQSTEEPDIEGVCKIHYGGN